MNGFFRTFLESFTPLRFRDFRIYLGGQAVSLIGTWLQVTAQAWLVWTITGSEAASGTVAMLSALPILLFGPWAGVWAERLDRRKLLIGTQVGAMLLAFILAFLVQTQTVQIWHVYILTFLLGVMTTLDLPAQQTFLGDLSGISEVRKAVNLNAMILQVSRMIGPALAGLVVARLGVGPAFWLNGISFLAVILSLVVLRSHQVRKEMGEAKPLQEIREAIRFLRTQPRMQDLFIFTTMVVLLVLSIILSMLPAVADKLLGGDAETLGALQAASGAGALVAVLFIIPLIQSFRRSGVAIAIMAIWMGVWFIIFALARTLPLSTLALFMGSMGAPSVIATSLGMIQTMSPADMRARIISLFTMITFGLQTFAVLIVGYVAETLGVATAIEINAVLLIAGAALMLIFRTELRRWVFVPPQHSAAAVTELAGD